jgi:ATP-dependent DNA helicase RecG
LAILADPEPRDTAFDIRPVPTATLADFNRRIFEEEYLPSSCATEVLAASDRSYELRLASARMVAAADQLTPTVLGLLVLGRRPRGFLPGACVQFLRVAGRELGDPIVDELLIDGPVAEVLRRVGDKLVSHNRTAVDFTNGSTEVRTQPYPIPALQQLLRNAVMHRAYEATNAPIHLYWFDDRIEISNPGGPYGAVTVESFGAPGLVDYRNPNLAEALRVLGFVQRFGFGIPTARRELERNGNAPPEFEVGPTQIRCRVRPAR